MREGDRVVIIAGPYKGRRGLLISLCEDFAVVSVDGSVDRFVCASDLAPEVAA